MQQALGDTEPTAQTLIDRAAQLVPLLSEKAAETEDAGRVLPEVMDAMRAAGLFRVQQPARYGGLEYGLDIFVRIVMELARGCGSTAWVYSVVAQHQWMLGMYPDEAQADVWETEPQGLAATSFAPAGQAVRTDGGFRLSGRWPFCSGVDTVQWLILGCHIVDAPEDEKGTQAFILIPQSEAEIVENWDVVGLIGTGSKDVAVNDLFVPGHRILTVEEAGSGNPPGAAVNEGPLFRIPFPAAISNCITVPAIGNAQGLLDDYVEGLKTRVTRGAITGAGKKVAEQPTIQLRIAEASAAVRAARLMVIQDCLDTMAAVEPGQELTKSLRIRNRRDHAYAVRLATQAVDRIFEAAGGQSLHKSNGLQRKWRDAHAMNKHISTNWDAVGALYGQFVLGLMPEGAHF